MSSSATKGATATKRYDTSTSRNNRRERVDLSPISKVTEKKTYSNKQPTIASQRRDVPIHDVTTKVIKPKTTNATSASFQTTTYNVIKGSPKIVPKTKTQPKSNTKQLPIPKARNSINHNQSSTDSSYTVKQSTTLNSEKEFGTSALPKPSNTSLCSSNENASILKNARQSTRYTPGLCGLINIGNTCYMNSALQCLSNIPKLTKWILSEENDLSKESKGIVHVYVRIIKSMWSGENNSIDPHNIKEIVSRSAPIFIDYAQKDSHEFMNSLLNALDQTKSISIMADLFDIHTTSQVTCLACHAIDKNDERTTCLPLPLPLPLTQKTNYNDEILLENLIHDFCLEDSLDGLYYCHSCKQYTQAKQKTSIGLPLPDALVIQLKRFPFDQTFKKIDTFVHYKLQHENLLSDKDIYELCAVCCHSGSLSSGHYKTVAKNSSTNEWYEFNDHHIRKVNAQYAITSHAYILVYTYIKP